MLIHVSMTCGYKMLCLKGKFQFETAEFLEQSFYHMLLMISLNIYINIMQEISF